MVRGKTGGWLAVFDWIVCLGAERRVVDMQVHCPMRIDPSTPNAAFDAEACLTCRHLLAAAVDRMPQFMCEVDWPAEAD